MVTNVLDEKSLNLAGWLSVVSAVLVLPLSTIGFFTGWFAMEDDLGVGVLYLIAFLNTGYSVIGVYILVMFRRLLNQKAAFHDVDMFIKLMIGLTIAVTVVGLITPVLSSTATGIVGIASIVLLMPFGVVAIVFGIKLLNCDDDFFGHLKPFSYLTIATGVLYGSVVLILFAPLTDAVSSVLLALVFFKSAKLVRTQGSLANEQTRITNDG